MILVKRSSFENVKTRYKSLPSSNSWRTSTVCFQRIIGCLDIYIYLLCRLQRVYGFPFRNDPAVRIVKTFSLQFFFNANYKLFK